MSSSGRVAFGLLPYVYSRETSSSAPPVCRKRRILRSTSVTRHVPSMPIQAEVCTPSTRATRSAGSVMLRLPVSTTTVVRSVTSTLTVVNARSASDTCCSAEA